MLSEGIRLTVPTHTFPFPSGSIVREALWVISPDLNSRGYEVKALPGFSMVTVCDSSPQPSVTFKPVIPDVAFRTIRPV